MSDIVQGACLCQGVKFAVKGTPENVFICFCTHCSKNAGAPGQIASARSASPADPSQSAKLPKESVQVSEGDSLLKTWVLKDNVSECDKHKVFCSQCGCTLWTIPMKHNGSHWIVRTSLLENGLEKFPYKAEFFASRKVPVAQDKVRSFPTMPGA